MNIAFTHIRYWHSHKWAYLHSCQNSIGLNPSCSSKIIVWISRFDGWSPDDLLIANELEECEYGQLLLFCFLNERHHLTVYFWYRWNSLYSANVLVFNPRLFKSFFFTSATFCSSPFSKWVMTDEWMIHTHSIEMNHPHHSTTYSISLFFLPEPGNLDYPSQNVLQQLMIIEQKAAFPQLCQCVSCLVCVCMLYVCLMIRVHWNDNFWQYAG